MRQGSQGPSTEPNTLRQGWIYRDLLEYITDHQRMRECGCRLRETPKPYLCSRCLVFVHLVAATRICPRK